jgi:hypothetical protein
MSKLDILQELKFQIKAYENDVIVAEDFAQAVMEIYEHYKM